MPVTECAQILGVGDYGRALRGIGYPGWKSTGSGGFEWRVWALGTRKSGGRGRAHSRGGSAGQDRGQRVYCPTGRLLQLGVEQHSLLLPNSFLGRREGEESRVPPLLVALGAMTVAKKQGFI